MTGPIVLGVASDGPGASSNGVTMNTGNDNFDNDNDAIDTEHEDRMAAVLEEMDESSKLDNGIEDA